MKTFIGKTVTASQPGTYVEIYTRGYGSRMVLEPDEARELGQWLLTVEVPQVKPESRGEIVLKEIGEGKSWPVTPIE